MNKKIMTALVLLLGLIIGSPQPGASADISFKLKPSVVQISAFYNGATIELHGNIPAEAEALIRIKGEGEDLHLKKKGKAGGLLWMNIGDVAFHNTPRAYMLYPSEALAGTIESSAELNLGFAALKDLVEISPATEDKDFLFGEFIQLKKGEKLYASIPGAVHYGTVENGMKSVKAELTIPPRMRPGSYTVELFAIEGGQVVGSLSEDLEIKMVGFPAQLSSLAFNHALAHGIMAVIIALAAGLFTGIMFKDRGGAH